MAEKAVGAGSVWNVNSWHWENKNYTPVAKDLITKKILDLTIQEGEIKINMLKLTNIKGEAHINIRKGKQILTYEFNIDVDWRAENLEDEADGSFKIIELNESDLDFQIEDITSKENNDIAKNSIQILKKNLQKIIETTFKNFNKEISEFEADPNKLEEDKKKREQAIHETLKAREEKGAEKERLLEEQRLKEQRMKQEYSQWKEK